MKPCRRGVATHEPCDPPGTMFELSVTCALIAGGLLMASCSRDLVRPPPPSSVDWHPSGSPTQSDASAAASTQPTIAQAYASALETPGFAALGPYLDADAHFFFPGVEEVTGRDAVIRAHDLLLGAFSERRVAVRRVLRSSSAQLLQWALRGVQTSTWFGVSVTGKAVEFEGLAVLATGEDEAVSDVHAYFDVASVEAQLRHGGSEQQAASSALGPSGSPQVVRQSGSSDEMHNTAVVRRWLDALDSIDRAAYLACLSEDVEVTTPERARPARGKEAAANSFEAIHRQIAELETRIDAIWGIGDFVGVEYSLTGEQTAPIGWVPLARDRVVRLQVADIAELHDGRITRVWRYLNLAQANAPNP